MNFNKLHIFFIIQFISLHLKAQDTSSANISFLESATVTNYKEKNIRENSLNINNIKIDSLSRYGNFNLTDLLAKTPGINMLSTGVGIAKPVIRGLYGNRVLVLLSGLKFDNQQWQEEHGLGLSDIGLSKVEVIKGPMSVLYGSEAMGGIINLIEEDKPKKNYSVSDFSIKYNTNTNGALMQGGVKENYGKKWMRIRVGIENHADYADGNNQRVLNSRFDGYYLKSTLGFQKKNWISINNFSSSFNRFGFIFNDIYSFVKPDNRWSRRKDENPTHIVLLNILSSENKVTLKNNSKLAINGGIQINNRLENEGGGAISLNMQLITFQYLLKWEKELNKNNRLIISHLGSIEDNTNFGSRKIIPDAIMQEANFSGYLETYIRKKLILENGLGIGQKYIKTFFTPSVNSPDKEIKPFEKQSKYYNIYSGFSYLPNKFYNLKLNLATGVRIPNLAELSSNGLHEGVFTYEIGSPLLKNEQIISLNIFNNYTFKSISITISPFLNYFRNYIYLAPTSEFWYGFPVYRYKQQDATQYGSEFLISKNFTNKIQLSSAYSGMISKTQDNNYTPYIPAQKITTNLNLNLKNSARTVIHAFTSVDYCFAQNNIYPTEIKTPKYLLWNLGISSNLYKNNTAYEISINGNNMLNTAYYDHMSRFKNFGLLNIGRNIALAIKIKFNKKIQP